MTLWRRMRRSLRRFCRRWQAERQRQLLLRAIVDAHRHRPLEFHARLKQR